jgi:hypothetical protein
MRLSVKRARVNDKAHLTSKNTQNRSACVDRQSACAYGGAVSSWWSYVQRVSRGAPQGAIADRTGISQSSIGRWQSSEPKVSNVRAFAEAYDRPVLEAFVAAGWLTQKEANLIHAPIDLTKLTDDELLEEIRRRMRR